MLAALKDKRRKAGRPMPRVVAFGFDTDEMDGRPPDFQVKNLVFKDGLPGFEVWHDQRLYCRLKLQVPGRHNVDNAMAAIACAALNGGTPEAAESALRTFQGAEGRFTFVGYYRGAQVIADYAHHPSAARATLSAAGNMPHPRTWVVFQPLTYSRTKVLLENFARTFKDCAHVILAEIFSDRETNNGDVSSRMLADRINELAATRSLSHHWRLFRKDLIN